MKIKDPKLKSFSDAFKIANVQIDSAVKSAQEEINGIEKEEKVKLAEELKKIKNPAGISKELAITMNETRTESNISKRTLDIRKSCVNKINGILKGLKFLQ